MSSEMCDVTHLWTYWKSPEWYSIFWCFDGIVRGDTSCMIVDLLSMDFLQILWFLFSIYIIVMLWKMKLLSVVTSWFLIVTTVLIMLIRRNVSFGFVFNRLFNFCTSRFHLIICIHCDKTSLPVMTRMKVHPSVSPTWLCGVFACISRCDMWSHTDTYTDTQYVSRQL